VTKDYKKGLFVGRFQPFHNGHLYAINYALPLCDQLIIGVGSSQESGTEMNPFTVETRIKMIEATLVKAGINTEKIKIVTVPDFPTDEEWTRHILEKHPDLSIVFTANDWVKKAFNDTAVEVVTPPLQRRDELSGTNIRSLIEKELPWQHLTSQSTAGMVLDVHPSIMLRAEQENIALAEFSKNVIRHIATVEPMLLKIDPEAIRVRDIGAGTRHYNYLVSAEGHSYTFRFSLTKNPREHIEYEYQGLKLLEELGIGPRAHYRETTKLNFGSPFVILDYIEGEPLKQIDETNVGRLAKLMAQLHSAEVGKVHRAVLHSRVKKEDILKELKVKIDYITEKREQYSRPRAFSTFLARAYEELLMAGLPTSSSEVVGHGDMNRTNIIETKNGLKLIDWETVAIVDPAYDIAMFFDRENLSPALRGAFLKEYQKLRKDPTLGERIDKFLRVRQLDRLCWCIWEAYDVKEGARGGRFPSWRTPEFYVGEAKKRFERCQNAGIIPKYVEWDEPF
jgi:nicotinamide-nucleotide adenylyltransferase